MSTVFDNLFPDSEFDFDSTEYGHLKREKNRPVSKLVGNSAIPVESPYHHCFMMEKVDVAGLAEGVLAYL